MITRSSLETGISVLFLGVVGWAPACSSSSEPVVSTERGVDASVSDGGSGAVAADDGAACTAAPVGRLCVRGVVAGETEDLTVGGKVVFQVAPKGCHSSSCTRAVEASCGVLSASADVITLEGKFCLGSSGAGNVCTPDCNGGGFTTCEQAGVGAGKYTARLGELEVAFEVPSKLPHGGTCVGSQF